MTYILLRYVELLRLPYGFLAPARLVECSADVLAIIDYVGAALDMTRIELPWFERIVLKFSVDEMFL